MPTPESLARELESFLADAPNAVVLENDELAFELADARYAISAEREKCLLHVWSAERNIVRRVLDCERKLGVLRIAVQRFGQSKPSTLEIFADRDRRAASARKSSRASFARTLKRVLEKSFPDESVGVLSVGMDLERSFSPVYARGLLKRGRSGWAVLGCSRDETQASIDGSVTFGLLWLSYLREKEAPRCYVEGLRLMVPRGTSQILRERMANLDHAAAKLEVFEFDERELTLEQLDGSDRGNIATRLVPCPNDAQLHERFASAIARVQQELPKVEVVTLSATEVAFRLHGLEVARARVQLEAGSFRSAQQIVFGAGAFETALTDATEPLFADLMARAAAGRHPAADKRAPLWRMQPERWLESLIVKDVSAVDARLEPTQVYSQVPAFSASDRAMIDVLTATRDGRLAVLELKADEDIHLPIQGLDYWARVRWHHGRGEFQKFGYFPGRDLALERPLLFLVAPAMRVHPATDTLLKFYSPEIDWTFIGIDERWRDGVKVVFRKSRA